MALSNFRVEYLLPQIQDPTARPDPGLSGYFRHEAVITATRTREAMQAVIDRGGVVLSVVKVRRRGFLKRMFGQGVSRTYKQKFLQALAFNVRSGLSPERALEQVILGELDEPRIMLNHSLDALRQGFGFVQALEILDWFDDSTIAVLQAGESAGQLSKALETAVAFYEKGSATLKLMFGAVTWTALDLVMAVSAVIGMRFGLIEELKTTELMSEDQSKIDQFNDALFLAEQVNNGLLLLSFLVAVGLMYLTMMVLSPDRKVRAQAFGWLERVPVVSTLLISSGLSATCRVLSSLLTGGVHFLNAVEIARRGTLTPTVTAFWQSVTARSEVGEPPASAFNNLMLEGSERLLLRAHRDQAQLAECLQSIADSREDRANMAARKFAVWAFVASLLYSGVAVLFSLWVVYLQNTLVLSGA